MVAVLEYCNSISNKQVTVVLAAGAFDNGLINYMG
jgi:hypothetical protein